MGIQSVSTGQSLLSSLIPTSYKNIGVSKSDLDVPSQYTPRPRRYSLSIPPSSIPPSLSTNVQSAQSEQVAAESKMKANIKTWVSPQRKQELEKLKSKLWTCVDIIPNKENRPGNYLVYRLENSLRTIEHGEGYDDKKILNALEAENLTYPGSEPLDYNLISLLNMPLEEKIDLYIRTLTRTQAVTTSNQSRFLQILDFFNYLTFSASSVEVLHQSYLKSSKEDSEYLNIINYFFRVSEVVRTLGFVSKDTKDGFFLQIPDRDALLYAYNELREKEKFLAPLDIHLCDTIVDDRTYIENFLSHTVIVAKDGAFVHDNVSHVIAAIMLLIQSSQNPGKEKYAKIDRYRFKIIKIFMPLVQSVWLVENALKDNTLKISDEEKKQLSEDLTQFQTHLSRLIDSTSTRDRLREALEFASIPERKWRKGDCALNPNHIRFLTDLYGDKLFTGDKISKVIQRIEGLANELKEAHKRQKELQNLGI